MIRLRPCQSQVSVPTQETAKKVTLPFFQKISLEKEASAAVSEVARSFVPVFFRILTLYSFLQTILPRGTP